MSSEIPYRPAPKPDPPSFEHMQQVLAKHRERHVEVKIEVPPSVPVSRPRLVWRKVSDWCIESACGGYRIEKFVADSAGMHCPAAVRFRCLKRNPEFFWHFDTTTDAQEARKRCEGQLNAQHG